MHDRDGVAKHEILQLLRHGADLDAGGQMVRVLLIHIGLQRRLHFGVCRRELLLFVKLNLAGEIHGLHARIGKVVDVGFDNVSVIVGERLAVAPVSIIGGYETARVRLIGQIAHVDAVADHFAGVPPAGGEQPYGPVVPFQLTAEEIYQTVLRAAQDRAHAQRLQMRHLYQRSKRNVALEAPARGVELRHHVPLTEQPVHGLLGRGGAEAVRLAEVLRQLIAAMMCEHLHGVRAVRLLELRNLERLRRLARRGRGVWPGRRRRRPPPGR